MEPRAPVAAVISTIHLSVSTHPSALYICSIPKNAVDATAKALVQLIFFSQDREDRFFSFTLTRDDFSLVIDEQSLHLFPQNALDVHKEKYRALQISFGSAGYTGTGIVRNCTAPLARAGISIFYLSTFNTDFIFVPESKIDAAYSALSEHLQAIHADGEHLEETLPESLLAPNNKLLVRNWRLSLAALNKEFLPQCAITILQLLFFPSRTQTFFHFTQTEDEVSLLLDRDLVSLFPSGALVVADVWNPIQRTGKRGFSETGVVSWLSKFVAEKKISMLYLSTFPSAFIMVQEKNINGAMAALREGHMDVLTDA